METNPNIIRLLEMLDNPGAYSEQEIRDIINCDEETRETYRFMMTAKQGYRHKQPVQPADVDAAWQRFESKQLKAKRKRPASVCIFYKIAASFIGILLASGIALAAFHFIQKRGPISNSSPDGGEKAGALITNGNDSLPSREDVEGAPVIFENMPLDSMLMEMADYYHVGVEFTREEARQLRFHFAWKRSESLDRVLERLSNFEAVNIEKHDTVIIVE